MWWRSSFHYRKNLERRSGLPCCWTRLYLPWRGICSGNACYHSKRLYLLLNVFILIFIIRRIVTHLYLFLSITGRYIMQWRLHENVSCAASHSTLHNARDIIDSLTAHGPKAKLMFYHEVISSDDFKVRFTGFFDRSTTQFFLCFENLLTTWSKAHGQLFFPRVPWQVYNLAIVDSLPLVSRPWLLEQVLLYHDDDFTIKSFIQLTVVLKHRSFLDDRESALWWRNIFFFGVIVYQNPSNINNIYCGLCSESTLPCKK